MSLPEATPRGEVDALLHEFQQPPEGAVRPGSVVLRPSLWVAAQRLLLFLSVTGLLLGGTLIQFMLQDEPRSAGEALYAIIAFGTQALLPLIVGLIPVVNILFTRYVVDDSGVRHRVQFLQKTENRVSWDKVTALQYRITLLDRLFGLERLDIIAYGDRGITLHLVGLRGSAQLRDLVARRMEDATSVERLFTND